MTDAPAQAPPTTTAEPRLLRIQEVAAELGLTTRSIRYYEEVGLLEPAARSEGDYRLYDASDLERLRSIKEPARRGRVLARPDRPAARGRGGPRAQSRADPRRPGSRRAPRDPRGGARRGSTARSTRSRRRPTASPTMIEEAAARRVHLDAHCAELDGGPAPPSATGPRRMTDPPRRPSPTHAIDGGVRVPHRNYRLFFAGQAVSLVGTWMQQVAQAWLVLQLTGDPFWLGRGRRRAVPAGHGLRAVRRRRSRTPCRSARR